MKSSPNKTNVPQQNFSIMSLKINTLLFFILISGVCSAQIPILNSYPSITNKVIYLDFDGQSVTGTNWNGGNTVNALASTMSASNINLIFQRISEDYKPFDVNLTTDSVRFNAAPANKRMRVIVTPTSTWYGSAGGVAYVGSFSWGGTPGTPCWVFENMLSYSAKNIAEAAAHEIGHTLSLRHQSTYTYSPMTCSKTAEYNPGVGTGVTSWAPIMGVGYSKNVTVWYNGTSATSCSLTQNDHSSGGIGLTSNGFLSFLSDDIGNTSFTGKILNLNTINVVDSGLITTPTDIDAFRFTICNTRNVTIDVKPWALDTVNYQGANLDVRLFLYNAANNQLVVDTSLTRLNARVAMNLNPGSYYFTVDGGRSGNYSDYGSIGRYYVKVKATNPPAMAAAIVTSNGFCAGQATTLTYTANGIPTQWQWTVNGPSITNTFTIQNPNVNFSAGIYTITLLASSINSVGCLTTATLNINTAPVVSISNSANNLCLGNSVILNAYGANSYTWMPGSLLGQTQSVNPQATTVYTVTGTNGTCGSSAIIAINVTPDFTLTASSPTAVICAGEAVGITAGGAATYSIEPGGYTAAFALVSPVSTTTFVITGQNGNCSKSTNLTIFVSPKFSINVSSTDTVLCVGSSATLNASGASNYEFNPGAFAGSSLTVTPNATTTYTISGTKPGNACFEDTTITVSIKNCDATSTHESANMNNQIHIYPNPAIGSFVIETLTNKEKIEVSNTLGQIITTQKMLGEPLQIITPQWPAGVYFVKIVTGTETSYTAKIIVE